MLFANVTFAFSVNVHICQGEFQSISFFGAKETCKKMVAAPVQFGSCCDAKKQDNQLSISQRSCCDNRQFSAATVLEKASNDQLSIEKTKTISASVDLPNAPIFETEFDQTVVQEILPAPPLLRIKRQAVLQVFQI